MAFVLNYDIPVKAYRISDQFFYLLGYLLLPVASVFAQQPQDSLKQHFLSPVIISANRTPQTLLHTPVSVYYLDSSDAIKMPAPSVFDALESVQGVQVLTPGLGFKVLNTRGFVNTTNVRFSQLVDGMDNQAPHIGAPIANALGANDLDIRHVEIVSGVSAVLYGMNAINGLASIRTKSPFEYPGFSVQQLTGVNRIHNDQVQPGLFTQTNLRYAKALSSKWAIKFTAARTIGEDWIADNYIDLAKNINSSAGLSGSINPALDEVNSYGNESPNRRTITLNGKKYVVARTGYREIDVADYDIDNFKSDAGVYFRPRSGHELSFLWKGARINSNYQRANRFRLQDYFLQQFGVNYENPYAEFRTYLTSENTGHSYNLRSLAENLDRNFKSDDNWFTDFTAAFDQAYATGAATETALQLARQAADEGRYVPGTTVFNQKKNELTRINNWDIGAALNVKSRLIHSEGMISWDKLFPTVFSRSKMKVLSGMDYRSYIIIPDENYFINPVQRYKNLLYQKHGLFTSFTRQFWNNRIELSGVMRMDKSDYFSWKINPRFTALFKPDDRTTFRAAAQSGYRFPSIFEGFSNVVSGGVKRVGGLRIMSSGIFENSFTKSSIDLFQSTVTSDINNGLTQAEAIEKNKILLKKNPYTYLQPEYVRSFEMGFRKIFSDGKISLDADVYLNEYRNLIAQMEASVPTSLDQDSIATYLYSKTKQSRYRLWTNSRTRIKYFGGSMGLRYNVTPHVQMQGNFTWAHVIRRADGDGLEDGFNTPPALVNLSISSDRLFKKVGGGLAARYQHWFDYVSFLVSGPVPSYFNLDAQLNYKFAQPDLYLKVGATNLLNRYYSNMLGGASLGGLYYISVTFNIDR